MLTADITPVAYGLGWLAVLLIPAVVTWLKGQRLLFVAGLLLAGIVWLVAALRLARPGSYWARRFYGPEKLARAKQRFSA